MNRSHNPRIRSEQLVICLQRTSWGWQRSPIIYNATLEENMSMMELIDRSKKAGGFKREFFDLLPPQLYFLPSRYVSSIVKTGTGLLRAMTGSNQFGGEGVVEFTTEHSLLVLRQRHDCQEGSTWLFHLTECSDQNIIKVCAHDKLVELRLRIIGRMRSDRARTTGKRK